MKTKGHISKNHAKECSILTGYEPFHGFFSYFFTHLFIFPLFLFFCSLSFAVLALYSSMSLLYVLISCSSWLSSLYSSSVPDLLVIQRINITTPSITIQQYLGWEWTSPKAFGIVGTVLAYNACILEMYWFTERLSLRPWDK